MPSSTWIVRLAYFSYDQNTKESDVTVRHQQSTYSGTYQINQKITVRKGIATEKEATRREREKTKKQTQPHEETVSSLYIYILD